MADTTVSFEDIKELFRENERKNQEAWEKRQAEWQADWAKRQAEREADMAKSKAEWEEIRAQRRETDRYIKQLSKQIGGLYNSLGELMETLIAARLWEKFADYPYKLRRGYRGVGVFDKQSKELTEIDILLADSEWVMAVEVKREVRKDDIDHHLKRMELIRQYPPAEVVGKKLLGAVAGGVVNSDVHNYAHQAGFFVLELRGENVSLVPQPDGFTPGIW